MKCGIFLYRRVQASNRWYDKGMNRGDNSQSATPQFVLRWLVLMLLLIVVVIASIYAWPYLSYLTDRDALREVILGAGFWSPSVYMLLQLVQVVVAPIPGTVISLAGGYVFETFWSTVYAMIGTTVGFFIVFTLSKWYGRSIVKYFISPSKVAKYDKIATSKGGFVFISLGFLFPFIPDPVIGYLAGTTPISTRVLMIICIVMRTPGVLLTSLVGSQLGQGNYKTVAFLVVAIVVTLLLSLVFYKQITTLADKLYAMAMQDSQKAHLIRHRRRTILKRRSEKLSKKPKQLAKKLAKTIRRRRKTIRRRGR